MRRFGKSLVQVVLWPVSSDAAVTAVAVIVLVVTLVVLVLALR